MKRMSEIAGCRFPFDNWASASMPICDDINKFKYLDNVVQKYLFKSELRDVINGTGCLVPCIYREYKHARKPWRESINSKDE